MGLCRNLAKISWKFNREVVKTAIQSTPDNSNLQGKLKKVRVINGKII